MPNTWKVSKLVTADARGVPLADGGSFASISNDGRYVAFTTNASLIATDQNNRADYYQKDLLTGAISLISGNQANVTPNGLAYTAAYSADGTEIYFGDNATNLVPGYGLFSSPELYAKNTMTGAVRIISVDAKGVQAASGAMNPIVSNNGRMLAYESAGNVVVEDLTTMTPVRISGTGTTATSNGTYSVVAFSTDGAKLLFQGTTAGQYSVEENYYLYDRTLGTTTRFLMSDPNAKFPGLVFDYTGSTAGALVAFTSLRGLTSGTPSSGDSYIKNMQTGELVRASGPVMSGTSPFAWSGQPSISPDGTKVVFTTSSILVPGQTDSAVFVRDLKTGVVTPVFGEDGKTPVTINPSIVYGTSFSWTQDSQSIVFHSEKDGLTAADHNGKTDVFIATLSASTTAMATANGHLQLTGNTMNGTYGDDRFVGGSFYARDTVYESEIKFSDAKISHDATGALQITSSNGVDTLVNVERVRFADGVLILDGGTYGASAYRLYQAALGRAPDEGGLLIQINQLERAHAQYINDYPALVDLARGFLGSAEFKGRYGTDTSNAAYIDALYHNVLGRAPDPAGAALQLSLLNSGVGREYMLAAFSQSAENIALTAAHTTNGLWSPYPIADYF